MRNQDMIALAIAGVAVIFLFRDKLADVFAPASGKEFPVSNSPLKNTGMSNYIPSNNSGEANTIVETNPDVNFANDRPTSTINPTNNAPSSPAAPKSMSQPKYTATPSPVKPISATELAKGVQAGTITLSKMPASTTIAGSPAFKSSR